MKKSMSRGDLWFQLLAPTATYLSAICPSVRVADDELSGEQVRFIAVVPDPENRYPRARYGEVGLLEGWTLAKVVNETVSADEDRCLKRPIIAIIDVPSQAYGRREEAFGIHQALAGATAAYTKARLAGHPVVGLIVGKAMSGAFLAHGYQANRLIAFNDPAVMVHAMGKESAARITLRSVTELEKMAATVPPMAYDIKNYQSLGLLDRLLEIKQPDAPDSEQVQMVRRILAEVIVDIRGSDCSLLHRLGAENRSASMVVREKMKVAWEKA